MLPPQTAATVNVMDQRADSTEYYNTSFCCRSLQPPSADMLGFTVAAFMVLFFSFNIHIVFFLLNLVDRGFSVQ